MRAVYSLRQSNLIISKARGTIVKARPGERVRWQFISNQVLHRWDLSPILAGLSNGLLGSCCDCWSSLGSICMQLDESVGALVEFVVF